MSSSVVTLLALTLSSLCLIYLRNSDPKVRRVFRLKPWGTRRYDKPAWFICFMPGLVLLLMQDFSAFIMWFAAFSLLGWLIALLKPKQV